MRVPVHFAWRGALIALCVSICALLAGSAAALAAPVVEGESVAEVSASSATLQAQVNPEGVATTYRFEYDTSEYASGVSHGTSVPASAGEVGEGASPVTVEAHVQGLQPATVYHFRVVLTSAGSSVDGPDAGFRTQSAGGELTLPDGRQWELVSPPVKEGGTILPIGFADGVGQAATNGDAMTYLTYAPTEPEPAGYAYEVQVLSARGPEGWSSRDIAPPHGKPTGVVVGAGMEYRFFSEDLSLSLVEPFGEGELPMSAKASERTGYIRDDLPVQPEAGEQALYHEAEAEAPAGSGVGYVPLVTPANVPPGTKFGKRFPLGVAFEGATPDLSHVIVKSQALLTSKSVEHGEGDGLYEWSGGQLQLVSVLSDAGETALAGTLGNANHEEARNAISANGSRVFWTPFFLHHLYMRDTTAGVTVQVDVAQGTPEPPNAEPTFQIASSDGSRVFFTSRAKLTASSQANEESGSRDLYECDVLGVGKQLECELSDLTVDPSAGEQAGVKGGVIGASEDGSYVYFVAQGALAPGATSGDCTEDGSVSRPSEQCNLYVSHESGGHWTTKLVATLSGEDYPDWLNPSETAARVSPDGHYLAFMSERSLTGYDNRDASSGVRDEEIYLYDALTGRLVCASCDPTGARPVGVEALAESRQLVDQNRIWQSGRWIAANVASWTEYSLVEALRQPRYLSNGGRLFFSGVDPLVARASNGVANVYEYEPAGEGGCTGTSVAFSAASGGCVALISAGSSGEESVFMDASENGDDVFFLTSARLAPQDLDTALDVYDAHVCSVAVPCPAVAVAPPPCTTADSCKAAPSPQPAIFGAPASATFSGLGNPAPPAAPATKAKQSKQKPGKGKKLRKTKGKGKTKTKGKRKRAPQHGGPRRRGGGKAKGRDQRRAGARGRGLAQVSGKSSSSSRTER